MLVKEAGRGDIESETAAIVIRGTLAQNGGRGEVKLETARCLQNLASASIVAAEVDNAPGLRPCSGGARRAATGWRRNHLPERARFSERFTFS